MMRRGFLIIVCGSSRRRPLRLTNKGDGSSCWFLICGLRCVDLVKKYLNGIDKVGLLL